MKLHAQWHSGANSSLPVLVWLHGFLGDAADWAAVACRFGEWPQLRVDLPGHGGSRHLAVADFDGFCARLTATLRHFAVRRYWLIGYSLGGRCAFYYSCHDPLPGLCGVIAEAAHPGLTSDHQRHARAQSDQRWAARFRSQPLAQTLAAWYRQPLFADLTASQREQLVIRRSGNQGAALAAMLQATSLSRQPSLLTRLHQLSCPIHYLCGDRDSKFQAIAAQTQFHCSIIPQAGHNAHSASPQAWAAVMSAILHHHSKEAYDLS